VSSDINVKADFGRKGGYLCGLLDNSVLKMMGYLKGIKPGVCWCSPNVQFHVLMVGDEN
jgi:hypothetical protein